MTTELPEEFIKNIQSRLGSEAGFFFDALQEPAPVSLRINRNKFPFEPELERVKWCETGYYLPARPKFASDPLWHAGAYYVQEASSMVLCHILKNLDLPENPLALDLCAAPGGKTTLLASVLPDAFVVANEVIKSRANVLQENVIKWGSGNIAVCNADPHVFGKIPNTFDLMVADAPCSGEGLFRKNEKATDEWSPQNVQMCSARQKRILTDALSCLKKDGILIYSTCTFAKEEDEENVEWLCSQGFETIQITYPEEWNISAGPLGAHFFPHKTKGEGFFVSVLRKKEGTETRSKHEKERGRSKPDLKIDFSQYLQGDWHFEINDSRLNAVPAAFTERLKVMKQVLRLRYEGIQLGELIRNELKPAHALAMSSSLKADIFPRFNLEREEALSYLHREDISLPEFTGSWALVCYKNIPLGWVKKAGNRLNNYYPKEWKLVSRFGEEEWFGMKIGIPIIIGRDKA